MLAILTDWRRGHYMLAGLNLGFYDWLSAFTYGLIAVSYSMRDMRLLRTITVVACFVYLFVYYNIRPGQPMWVSFGMSILFIAINGYQLWTLWRDSRTSDFSAEESFMYGTVFSSLQPGEFRRLLSLGRYDMVPAGASWVRAGAPVSSVALIVAGEASVMLDETVVSRLKRGDFIGEMGYITRQPASAAVQAATELRLFYLDYAVIDQLSAKSPELHVKLTGTFGRNVAEKLRDFTLTAEKRTRRMLSMGLQAGVAKN